MDFQINYVNGLSQMTFLPNTDIRTNIWFSINIVYGQFWQNKTFGCKLNTIKKITSANILLATQYVSECLQWMIAVGRATNVSVIVEKDNSIIGQLDIRVTATQPNGLVVSYQQFYRVG